MSILSEKFVKKYMRLAKQIGEDTNPCYSRQIGAVIVNPVTNRVLGTGYNGPPRNVPHHDTCSYILNGLWPQLSHDEKIKLVMITGLLSDQAKNQNADLVTEDGFVDEAIAAAAVASRLHGSHKCPRRLMCVPSGAKMEYCAGCCHAETNAIVNAAKELHGSWMFCWCPLPCYECTRLMINAGIVKVYCLKADQDYSPTSRWMMREAGIEIVECDISYCLSMD